MTLDRIKKILVIKLRHIGDVLLTIPVFRALRETFPDAHITALVNSGTEDVLKGSPSMDEIITFDKGVKGLPRLNRFLREMDFLRQIRKRGFDMTVDLTGGDRAAILSFISGARYRLGWESGKGLIGKRHLYTHLFRPDGKRHMVLQNLDIIRQFGISTDNLSVDLFIPDEARTFVKEMFEKNNLPPLAISHQPVVHIHLTSRWLFKCWKDEYMAEVMGWLLDNNATVVVTSSPDSREMEKAKRILALCSPSVARHPSLLIDLCGKTTIKQLAAVSEESDLFLGVDSAPMHIAAAVGTPVIALFGPSGAYSWGPWDSRQKSEETPYKKRKGMQISGIHTVIQRDWDCIPCGKDGCDGSKISKCLEDIKPEEVIEMIRDKLKAKG